MRSALLIVAVLVGPTTGCASQKAAPTPMCRAPRTMNYSIEATERVNPDDQGQALATVVRIYQLRDVTRLENAEFEDLWLRGSETLEDDLIKVEEHTLFPKDRVRRRVEIAEGVGFLAAVALFRKPAGVSWRALYQLPLGPCPGGKAEQPAEARFVLEDYQVETEAPLPAPPGASARTAGADAGTRPGAPMKPPQRVVWSEGMLMSPNHMQQLDAYHEDLLTQRLRAVTPQDWGVVRLTLDQRALDGGQIAFSELVAVLPDGLYLAFDHDDPETPASRAIAGHFGSTQQVLEVFVGVPREREGSANLDDGAQAARTRFRTARRPIWDTTTGAGELPVAFAQRNAVVLFGDDPRDDHEVLKVAEVVRDEKGAARISDLYVPPCLRLSASRFLVDGLERTLARAVAKQRSMSEARRQRDDATIEFGASDVTRYLLLHALNSSIPVLAHLAQSADLTPRAAYLALCQFAGALMSFTADADPTSLPPFSHTDLRSSFEPLFARVIALINATVREDHVSVTLDARQDGLHLGRLDDERFLRATQFLLAVRSSKLSESQIAESLPKLAKIASWNDIPQLVQATSPGVPVTLTHRPPAEIPVKAGVVYFDLAAGDRSWRNVTADRNLAVYLPPPFLPADTHIQLLAVPGPTPARPRS